MSYRRLLVTRWSERDRLAVAVVAVAVAFLTGATVLLLAAGAQTTAIAGQFTTPGSVEAVAGDVEAGPGETVVPVATVASNRSATPVTVVGVPANASVVDPGGGGGTTLGTLGTARTERLGGTSGVALSVTPRGSSTFPPSWYVTDPATVRDLGASESFVVRADAPTAVREGVPLVGALAFFVLGTREAVGALGVTAAGAALLVGVTVYSVSRMSVRDRLATIQVVRATGGTGRTVVGVFTLRAALLTAVAVALGYAGGVIVARTAVSVAVAVGLPTALPVRVTATALRVLGPLYVGVVGVGALAGGLAALPVARCPPGQVTDTDTRANGSDTRVPTWLRPRLLGTRALVPTTATLTAFVVFLVLVAGLAAAAGPVLAADGVTVTEPGSVHPAASSVPAGYATALRDRGIDASGEILLFEVVDGQPFVARGAAFGAFANVTDARLATGRAPADDREAVVGADLARTLDVEPGETLTLGGSTEAAVTRVTVVGIFTAPGPYDDQLVVGLPTARHLAGVGGDQVQFVRAATLPDRTATGEGTAELTGVSTGPALAGEPLTVRATVRNLGLERTTESVRFGYRGQTRTREVTVPAGTTRTVEATFPAGEPGTYTLTAGNRSTSVTVRDRAALSVEVPTRVPPDSEPLVRVTDATGAPVADAAVTLANDTRSTDADGRVRLPPAAPGSYTVRVTAGARETTAEVSVTDDVGRDPTTTVSIAPTTPTLLDEPAVSVRLANPWAEPVARTVRVTGPGTAYERTVALPPGADRAVSVSLPQRSPGRYEVTVALDGEPVATRSYEVVGDDRVAAALASSGRAGTTGIGQAIAVAVGNLQVVLAALLGLAALMTVGGTTATFAQAVHARRQTLGVYRATGASPWRIIQLVARDALLVGLAAAVVATLLAQVGLALLARAGLLTVFGVRLPTTLEPAWLAVALVGSVAVTLLGAGVATARVVAAAPASLLAPVETPDSGTVDTASSSERAE